MSADFSWESFLFCCTSLTEEKNICCIRSADRCSMLVSLACIGCGPAIATVACVTSAGSFCFRRTCARRLASHPRAQDCTMIATCSIKRDRCNTWRCWSCACKLACWFINCVASLLSSSQSLPGELSLSGRGSFFFLRNRPRVPLLTVGPRDLTIVAGVRFAFCAFRCFGGVLCRNVAGC